jgi:transposase InsO family protein
MTLLAQRKNIVALISEARDSGARLTVACAQIGIAQRTLQRWLRPQLPEGDQRVSGQRRLVTPHNKLTEVERKAVMNVLNSAEFKDLPPSQIVPRLADQQIYLASESTMLRLLRAAGQLKHRRAERASQQRTKPRALQANAPNQIYSWDITYLPTQVRGQYFYLYLFLDIFSRKAVGWQVFDCESAHLASQLVQDICIRQGIAPGQLTLHSDNGAPMKGETMLATLQRLGVAHTRSRAAVSNDNPYSESVFKTLKYRPQYPVRPFEDVLQARRWVTEVVHWYNHAHRHSAIGFVTPAERHAGHDQDLLQKRIQVYTAARQNNPQRWSRQVRQWHFVDIVHLNPDSTENKENKSILIAA